MKVYLFVLGLLLSLGNVSQGSASNFVQGQGLIGSIWTGQAQSGDGVISYIFQFNQEGLSVQSTCQVDEISSALKSDLAMSYTENGNTAEIKSGLQSTIPVGHGSCIVNFPASLKFILENNQMFIEYNGTRRASTMKRQI